MAGGASRYVKNGWIQRKHFTNGHLPTDIKATLQLTESTTTAAIPLITAVGQLEKNKPTTGDYQEGEQKMTNKTPWKKIVSDSEYLGEADFTEGEEKVGTIARVAAGVKIKSAEGTSEKSVVYFKENIKPLILNVSRAKAITKVARSRFVEDWPGTAIQLYVEDGVKAFGDVVSAVRVRPRPPMKRTEVEKCADCGGDVQGAMGKGADYIANYTKKKFGVCLCFDCAQKRSDAAQKGGVTNGTA